jgi:hypothetical protein
MASEGFVIGAFILGLLFGSALVFILIMRLRLIPIPFEQSYQNDEEWEILRDTNSGRASKIVVHRRAKET